MFALILLWIGHGGSRSRGGVFGSQMSSSSGKEASTWVIGTGTSEPVAETVLRGGAETLALRARPRTGMVSCLTANETFILTITVVGQSMVAFAMERMETVVVKSPPPVVLCST